MKRRRLSAILSALSIATGVFLLGYILPAFMGHGWQEWAMGLWIGALAGAWWLKIYFLP